MNVRRRNLNAICEITGGRVTAKDFRTWAGTLFGACALARGGYPDPPTARALKRGIAEAMRETAELLGNTPAVCRASYVSPGILGSESTRTPADRSSLARASAAPLRAFSATSKSDSRGCCPTGVDPAGNCRCFLSRGPTESAGHDPQFPRALAAAALGVCCAVVLVAANFANSRGCRGHGARGRCGVGVDSEVRGDSVSPP